MRGVVVGVVLLGIVAVGSVAGTGAVAQVDDSTVDVGLSTGDTLDGSANEIALSNGSTATVHVVVEGATAGVGSTELSLSVDNQAAIQMTDVRLEGNGTVTDTSVGDNGTTATVNAVGLDQEGESITVVAVDVTATGEGTSSLALSVDSVGDRNGQAYGVNVTDGSAEITVGEATGAERDGEEDESDGDGGGGGLPSGPLVGVFVLAAVVGYLLYRRSA